jgi:hypothetical protein
VSLSITTISGTNVGINTLFIVSISISRRCPSTIPDVIIVSKASKATHVEEEEEEGDWWMMTHVD